METTLGIKKSKDYLNVIVVLIEVTERTRSTFGVEEVTGFVLLVGVGVEIDYKTQLVLKHRRKMHSWRQQEECAFHPPLIHTIRGTN